MLSKMEYQGYRDIVEGKETQEILSSSNPDMISKLGGDMACYYARLSGEYADIRDEIMGEFVKLVQPGPDGSKGMTASQAEKESEINVNARHEVTRRQIEYLMQALDKIGFACSARVRSFSKEGNF